MNLVEMLVAKWWAIIQDVEVDRDRWRHCVGEVRLEAALEKGYVALRSSKS